ncbi:MAG: tRNA (N(6)-L-threonylcarbamoyladenosine(37)-C(2))-methylthiotransferase [Methanomassiliicoccales archaeon]|nr:tRNA (N(6)-L-threonylcarbamoyladenosine(37)-C(2))-methylthiotransferase [Methanomassiliicoccales archaeon]
MKFFVETYGCTMNQGEGIELSEKLRALGHQPVSSADEAELIILNTCTVIQSTQTKILKRLRELYRLDKNLIVSGCMAAIQPEIIKKVAPNVIVLSPQEYDSFQRVITENYGRISGQEIIHCERTTAIIPIAQGCLGSCTYCITRLARGRLRSYMPDQIVEKARRLVESGARELLLTAQDTASYGFDIGCTLSDLISSIVQIPGKFRIRIGMMNPESLQKIVDDLIDSWRSDKVYKFLHLPVQSGSERILKLMGRRYTVEQFRTQVQLFRSFFPDLTLSTDVITGFPGENDTDHKMTVKLIKEIRPNILNVTRFSPRPGTPAANASDQIPSWISKERSRELTKLRFQISKEIYKAKEGAIEEILITEKGKYDTLIGRTISYVPVVVRGGVEVGSFVKVRIIDSAPTHLLGEVIS